jgi:hypothetical protein
MAGRALAAKAPSRRSSPGDSGDASAVSARMAANTTRPCRVPRARSPSRNAQEAASPTPASTARASTTPTAMAGTGTVAFASRISSPDNGRSKAKLSGRAK